MKPASLPPLLLLAAVAAAATPPVSAGVRVEVDAGAPFTEADLADAVAIRAPEAADGARGDVVIKVARLGWDQLVVVVGDRSQVVTLPDQDRAASSRVVALIVTGMLDEPRPAVVAEEPMIDGLAAPASPAPAPAHRTSFLAGAAMTRDDNGYWIPLATVGAARAVAPSVRLVGTLGFGRFDGYLDTSSLLVPVRVGIEGRAGAAAIELGGQVLNFRESSCGDAEWGHRQSAYGAAKVFLPLGARSRLVGELGGHFVVGGAPTLCDSASNFTAYGGWLGAGVEWAH